MRMRGSRRVIVAALVVDGAACALLSVVALLAVATGAPWAWFAVGLAIVAVAPYLCALVPIAIALRRPAALPRRLVMASVVTGCALNAAGSLLLLIPASNAVEYLGAAALLVGGTALGAIYLAGLAVGDRHDLV